MNPVAFEVFGMPIRWYGIIIASGVLVAFFVSYLLAKKKGLDFDIITDGFLWSFP
ncbi:MAG: prolipoprotein diacylglyceryl transferase, partial [Bacilli bacterium]|nr:prolipoprotein diacylglyceryl transferase [Bacilli bacterium]